MSSHVPALAPQIFPPFVVARLLIVFYGWSAPWEVLAHVEGACGNSCHCQGCHSSQEHLQHARRLSGLMDRCRPLSDISDMDMCQEAAEGAVSHAIPQLTT